MSEDLAVRRCDGMIEAEVDGELVRLHVDQGTCHGFNATPTRIWGLSSSRGAFPSFAKRCWPIMSSTPDLRAGASGSSREQEASGLVKIEAPKG